MQTRTPRALVAAAALALFAGACTDVPTSAPAARAPGDSPSFNTGSGATLVSNSVKYRDTGGKPATGRSGNAVVDAQALLDKQGQTTLEFYVRHATEWWRSGTTPRVQVKASAPGGKHKYTRNIMESATWYGPADGNPGVVQLPGLSRGDRVQLQAHVAGLDRNRMDVVTVAGTVKRLPDLGVELTAPAEAQSNTPVNVLATVSELNGDVGTDATCELYAGWERLDYVHGMWVDAGDVVTCAFTVSLAPGTHDLEVRVSGGNEWDSANNVDSATIQVHAQTPQFYHSANFTQSDTENRVTYYESWRDTFSGLAGESTTTHHNRSRQQTALLHAYMAAPATGPIELRTSMSTGGREVHSAQWTQEAQEGWWCSSRMDGRVSFWICSEGDSRSGFTQLSYSFIAGTVTYHSHGYSRVWDELTGTDQSVYHWNEESGWDDGLVELGEDWTFDVRLGTPAGEHAVARTLALSNQGVSERTFPYTCTTWDMPEWGYSSTNCNESWDRSEYVYGY